MINTIFTALDTVFSDTLYCGIRQGTDNIVEVCYDSIWGTICDDGFGTPEADLICRELGHA